MEELKARKTKAFSLVELMIAVSIIGILAATGLPVYRSYVATSNMSRVNAAYEHAVRIVQEEFSRDAGRLRGQRHAQTLVRCQITCQIVEFNDRRCTQQFGQQVQFFT